MLAGVFPAQTKSKTAYFRASVTYQRKHISLGSFPTEQQAHRAYETACRLLRPSGTKRTSAYQIEAYRKEKHILSFEKWVSLMNLRDNGIYIKTPIYLHTKYFVYYYSPEIHYKFDVDDLFYYSHHKIMKRNGHLFVADYGMQVNILSRYGIKNYAVAGRDYRFVNDDTTDFRYRNIEIINRYHGVTKQLVKGKEIYITKILISGSVIVGKYTDETDAAIAYNKAAAFLMHHGIQKNYPSNYIDGLSELEYLGRYNKVRISARIRSYETNPLKQ